MCRRACRPSLRTGSRRPRRLPPASVALIQNRATPALPDESTPRRRPVSGPAARTGQAGVSTACARPHHRRGRSPATPCSWRQAAPPLRKGRHESGRARERRGRGVADRQAHLRRGLVARRIRRRPPHGMSTGGSGRLCQKHRIPLAAAPMRTRSRAGPARSRALFLRQGYRVTVNPTLDVDGEYVASIFCTKLGSLIC